MRYDLRRDYWVKPASILAGVLLASVLWMVETGFQLWMVLVMAAFGAGYLLLIEGGYWRNNYVIFHDEDLDVSRFPWGAGKWYWC